MVEANVYPDAIAALILSTNTCILFWIYYLDTYLILMTAKALAGILVYLTAVLVLKTNTKSEKKRANAFLDARIHSLHSR